MEHDFIVGFTIFGTRGFKTMYRHFNSLETAKMFSSNVNLKDNSKIYVDLEYYNKIYLKLREKIEILEKLQNEFKDNEEIRIKIIAYKELLKESEEI